jgi:hypothetical protein
MSEDSLAWDRLPPLSMVVRRTIRRVAPVSLSDDADELRARGGFPTKSSADATTGSEAVTFSASALLIIVRGVVFSEADCVVFLYAISMTRNF